MKRALLMIGADMLFFRLARDRVIATVPVRVPGFFSEFEGARCAGKKLTFGQYALLEFCILCTKCQFLKPELLLDHGYSPLNNYIYGVNIEQT